MAKNAQVVAEPTAKKNNRWVKIKRDKWMYLLLLPGVLYFIIFLLVSYFFHRQKKIHIFSREERYFSFFDIYLISMTNTLFISMTLLSVWNNMMFNIPYLVNSFTQLLTFSVNGILRSIITYLVLIPLCKIDHNIAALPSLNRA